MNLKAQGALTGNVKMSLNVRTKNLSFINGKEHVSTLKVRIDFAQATEVPSENDQGGQMYFCIHKVLGSSV